MHISTRLSFHLILAAGCLALLAACSGRTAMPATAPTAQGLQATATAFAPLAPTAAAPGTAQPTAAPTSPVTPAASKLGVFFRSGQTFITWPERGDLNGEVYTLYRAAAPIDAGNYARAQKIAQTGKYSARFYASRRTDEGVWGARFLERLILHKGQHPLPEGTGLLVWTLSAADFGGQASGAGYYAVTVTPPGQAEEFLPEYTFGPLQEAVEDPLPVEITYTPDIHPGPGGHFYIQYMDLRHWNATFHAPNSTNQYLGYDPGDPNLAYALAYAYDYSVFEPTEAMCGGKIPEKLPVVVILHGWRNNRYPTPVNYDNPACAYTIYPVDETETWYFGFAQKHDFRKGGEIAAGDVIENYTEQRVLRMIYDLIRQPPADYAVDTRRIYVDGQSMGGTGALAFAERYPNVFAAAYAGQPMTNYRTSGGTVNGWPADVTKKWGAPELNLPVAIAAPGNWAAHLQKYNGVGVWDWQNYQASLHGEDQPGGIAGRAADDMAPFGIDHGDRDPVIPFTTQAQPLYPLLNASGRAWSGAVIDAEHTWTNLGWMLPALAKKNDAPFWNYSVVRDETVPGFSNLSSNDPNPPTGPTAYNMTILWSASWEAWDGAPVDRPDEWAMSFCAVKAGGQVCGTGETQTVDITPRRRQAFVVTPGAVYDWENRLVNGGQVVASGSASASAGGLLTIKGFTVSPAGNRLVIHPHQP